MEKRKFGWKMRVFQTLYGLKLIRVIFTIFLLLIEEFMRKSS